MPISSFTRPVRASGLAIGACFAMLIASNVASAGHWRLGPTISGAPATTDVAGSAYSFTPTARGPSGYKLTFSISGKPAWASFNTATGLLAGTPTAANVGSFANIVIGVSDGVARASLAPFTIRVSAPPPSAPPPPAPPTISGSAPATATVGTVYTFTPAASDTAGTALSFSVQNLPAWATFSIATGTLSGTPAAANVGSYSGIVISVSNGDTSASLAPFSITVSQPAASGTATLTWTPPVSNTDGSALTDLAGYNVYYGTSASAMSTEINVGNAGATSYTISGLGSGTWYFAVTAYTTSGLQSALSDTGSKVIP